MNKAEKCTGNRPSIVEEELSDSIMCSDYYVQDSCNFGWKKPAVRNGLPELDCQGHLAWKRPMTILLHLGSESLKQNLSVGLEPLGK